MKVFISWSGDRSRAVAEALRDWLPRVINAAEPWLSLRDIEPGARWVSDIAHQLEGARFGLICLTRENLDSTWIHFEAGALSKSVDESRVMPYLLNLEPTDVRWPLAQFQAVQANLDGTKRVVYAINGAVKQEGEKSLEEKILDEVINKWWPDLQEHLPNAPSTQNKASPVRSDRDILEEILKLIRGMAYARPKPFNPVDKLSNLILEAELAGSITRERRTVLENELQKLKNEAMAKRDAIWFSEIQPLHERLVAIPIITPAANFNMG